MIIALLCTLFLQETHRASVDWADRTYSVSLWISNLRNDAELQISVSCSQDKIVELMGIEEFCDVFAEELVRLQASVEPRRKSGMSRFSVQCNESWG